MANPTMSKDECKKLINYIEKLKIGEPVNNPILDYPRNKDDANNWVYDFWKNKPVQNVTNDSTLISIIDENIKNSYTKQVKMISPYEWVIFEDKDLDDIVEFINKYNCEKKDKFRTFYSKDFIKWMLGTNHNNYKMLGIKTNNIIGGIILASIGTYQLFNKELLMGDIKLFCIHPKLRKKGIAQLLIDEMSRLLINDNVISGSFATNRYVPSPISCAENYHRPLNYEKLHGAGFVQLENGVDIDKAVSVLQIKYKHKHKVKLMEPQHYKKVYELLCEYQDKYNYYQKYSFDEFVHHFGNSDIVSSYIITENGNILDFVSYYKLPYFVAESEKNTKLPKYINNACMNMYTSLNVTQLTIFKTAILCAYEETKNECIDVFTCYDIMENMDILFDNFSKFTRGKKSMYYNLFNITCPQLSPQQICKTII